MPSTRWGRDATLLLILALAVFVGLLGGSDGSWFPQEYARPFYIAKGLVAVAAVCLIVLHMSLAWPGIRTSGQRLRYIALLMMTVLIASGSTAQLDEGAPVLGRNVGGLLVAVLVIVAMVVSIHQDRRP